MPNTMEREQVLLEAPFRDIFALVGSLNDKITEYSGLAEGDANKAPLAAEINEIKQVITGNIIPLIAHSNIPAIRQGTVLIGSQDKEIVKLLNNRLLEEIKGNPLNFGELYKALAQVNTTQSSTADDMVQAAQALTEKMDSAHAPDIGLTCLILQSMYAVLFQMIKDGKVEHIYAGHKKQIEKSLASFENRLQAVKPNDRDEQGKQVLANLKEAIKFSKHALRKLGDHRTKLNQTLHRIKIAGSLLLQAAEVGAECYGAVATMGVGAPSAISAAGRLITQAVKRAKQVYQHYHDNKSYFVALTEWSESFGKLAEKASTAKAHINALKNPEDEDDKDIQKSWYNPHFQIGVMRVLIESYSLYPDLQPAIVGLFTAYYKGVIPSETEGHIQAPTLEEKQQVKQQASFYLLKILEDDKEQNKLAPALKQSIEKTVTEEDRARYQAYQQAVAVGNVDVSQYNLATEGWAATYSEDVQLYKILCIAGQQQKGLEEEQINYLRNLRAQITSGKLSGWGRKLLSLIKEEDLNKSMPAGNLTATLNMDTMGVNMGLTPEIAKQLGMDPEFISKLMKTGIEEGTKALGNMKLSEDIKEQQEKNRESFNRMIIEASKNIVTVCTYYSRIMGCLVFDVKEQSMNTAASTSTGSNTSSSAASGSNVGEKKSIALTK